MALVNNLSTGLFPTLATTIACPHTDREPLMSPCLELVRQLLSPQIRRLLRASSGSSLWRYREGDGDGTSRRSIYTDSRDIVAHRREVNLLRVEVEYRWAKCFSEAWSLMACYPYKVTLVDSLDELIICCYFCASFLMWSPCGTFLSAFVGILETALNHFLDS